MNFTVSRAVIAPPVSSNRQWIFAVPSRVPSTYTDVMPDQSLVQIYVSPRVSSSGITLESADVIRDIFVELTHKFSPGDTISTSWYASCLRLSIIGPLASRTTSLAMLLLLDKELFTETIHILHNILVHGSIDNSRVVAVGVNIDRPHRDVNGAAEGEWRRGWQMGKGTWEVADRATRRG